MTKKYVIIREGKIEYDSDNYLNAKRKAEQIEAQLYEELKKEKFKYLLY